MTGMFLSVAVKNANFMIPRGIREISPGPLPRHIHVHQLCTYFRQRGVARLLLEGVPEGYYVNAMQSAAAFLLELRRAADAAKATSFARPFFDAVSAGYWDAALDIVASSRTTWNPDFEYEDDFYYVWFLMLACKGAPPAELDDVLAHYRDVLEGVYDARWSICRALFDRDERAFDGALRRLLDRRRDEVDELSQGSAMRGETTAWLQHFALEGVALLRIAERLGLSPAHDFLHCPDVLRTDSPFVFDPNAWMQPDFRPTTRSTP
ncbi:MAG: immunity 49 family protein [Deltaproteobacteria bacterium]|nr:immunity 49 family protein [Deltaproteobacteria bacterium]MBP7286901.1 immunity 49 family protein [Nannocystaceae bacterium]